MPNYILITAGTTQIKAELYDSPTAQEIVKSLPIKSQVNRWGGELYFTIPVSVPLEEDSRDILEPGELGYWPTGDAFCIFFGSTPASQEEECRAASNVNVFGKVISDLSPLWDVEDGTEVMVEMSKGVKSNLEVVKLTQEMNNSFLNYVDNRKGERLIQGVLLFLLETDSKFRQSFCDWVGWDLCSQVQEEYSDGDQRHDMVFFYKDHKKRIELKFGAGWTPNQKQTPDAIDLIILPKARLDETKNVFCNSMIRSWEELEKKVIHSSAIAKVLLSGLDHYYWSPGSLENHAEYEKLINIVNKSFEYGNEFFCKFASKIKIMNLSVGKISYSLKAWKGFYIKNSLIEDRGSNFLWFGITINADKWNNDKSLEFTLVLQIGSKEIATNLSDIKKLPKDISYVGHDEGIIVERDSNKMYSLKKTWEQCEELLTQYSKLSSEKTDSHGL